MAVVTFVRLPAPRHASFGRGMVSANTLFDQKVWDSGSGGRWCYYTKAVLDASPASNETAPNHTGTISTHVVLGAREG